MSTLPPSHLNHDVTVIPFWNKQLDTEHSPDSILIGSVKILELDTSFDKHDVTPSLVSLVFLHLINTIFVHSKWQLAPNMKF